MPEESLKTTLENLPAFPATVDEALRLLGDESSSIDDIARVIASDPLLSGKLLGLSNAACYGFRKKIKNVETALIVLGVKTTGRLLQSIAAVSVFRNQSEKHFLLQLLRYSLRIGTLASAAHLALAAQLTGDEFTAGLMHNLGHAVLERLHKSRYVDFLNAGGEPFVIDIEAEAQAFTLNHCRAGRLLGEHWALPAELTACLAGHHLSLDQDNGYTLPALIRLALRLDADLRLNGEIDPAALPENHFATALDKTAFAQALEHLARDTDTIEGFLLD